MTKQEFNFQSADGETMIHGVSWSPEGEVIGILQICHGMMEYIERYEPFAEFMTEKGFYVVGHDHLGHGDSITSEDKRGYFHEPDGNRCLIEDIHQMRQAMQEANPDFPYFILGHSMGSFLVRQYLTEYGENLDGAIIMGTGHHSLPELLAGQAVCRILAGVKGWDYRSQFVKKLAMGSYNRHFKPEKTGAEWLTRDETITAAYIKDPLCNFDFTVNAFYHMFSGMKTLMRSSSLRKIPVNLPVFFVAGRRDPVGNMGKSVIKVYNAYKKNNIQDVKIKLYKDDRHELLNELDREYVYEDIFRWMERRVENRDPDIMRVLSSKEDSTEGAAAAGSGSQSGAPEKPEEKERLRTLAGRAGMEEPNALDKSEEPVHSGRADSSDEPDMPGGSDIPENQAMENDRTADTAGAGKKTDGEFASRLGGMAAETAKKLGDILKGFLVDQEDMKTEPEEDISGISEPEGGKEEETGRDTKEKAEKAAADLLEGLVIIGEKELPQPESSGKQEKAGDSPMPEAVKKNEGLKIVGKPKEAKETPDEVLEELFKDLESPPSLHVVPDAREEAKKMAPADNAGKTDAQGKPYKASGGGRKKKKGKPNRSGASGGHGKPNGTNKQR